MSTGTPDGRDARDPRPVVRLTRQGLPAALIGTLALAAALLLFAILEHGRTGRTVPVTSAPSRVVEDLALPALAVPAPPVPPAPKQEVRAAPPFDPGPPVPQAASVRMPALPSALPPPPPQRVSAEPVLTFDNPSVETAAAGTPDANATDASAAITTRPARPTRMRSLTTTIPQGTLIPAVLETALDSTRPGLARAIVSVDTRGFDGKRILIPRGSRLVGAYQSQTTPEQKRALVTWTRLIRPDGVSIELASPGGDTLGRAGITGSVDNHFFERFGGALLQSALSLGVNVATAKVTDVPLILGAPGMFGGLSGATGGSQRAVPPTVRVAQGTPISIFVARDLDFSGFEVSR